MLGFKAAGLACALALASAGAAAAAPIALQDLGARAPLATPASVTNSSMAGKMKQRHRSRLDRCRAVPSRC